jgi:hypothetical protein
VNVGTAVCRSSTFSTVTPGGSWRSRKLAFSSLVVSMMVKRMSVMTAPM